MRKHLNKNEAIIEEQNLFVLKRREPSPSTKSLLFKITYTRNLNRYAIGYPRCNKKEKQCGLPAVKLFIKAVAENKMFYSLRSCDVPLFLLGMPNFCVYDPGSSKFYWSLQLAL